MAFIYTFNECSPISSTGWGLAPTLVPNLDAAVVVFKLDDLHLILVSPPPQPNSLVIRNLDDLRNVIRCDDLYLLGSQNLALCLKCEMTTLQETNTCWSFIHYMCETSLILARLNSNFSF